MSTENAPDPAEMPNAITVELTQKNVALITVAIELVVLLEPRLGGDASELATMLDAAIKEQVFGQ